MKYVACFLFAIFFLNRSHGQNKKTVVFVGTYTDGKPGKGIYVYSLQAATGELQQVSNAENIINPSFLTVSKNGQFLFACTDTKKPTSGNITSFKIDSVTGKLLLINKQSSCGANPVYLTTDNTSHFIISGNYTEGNVSVLPVNDSGRIDSCSQAIQFIDSSVNKQRQEHSHIHSTIFSPDYHYLYLPDLGADKIRVFRFNPGSTKPLEAMEHLTVHTLPGSGPRHLVFHPNKKFAYNIEEMSGMISGYSYNNGRLSGIQRIFSNSKKAAEYSSADIHISPDGRFLYASNRVENTLSIFSIHSNGTLALIGHQSTFGDGPRNFNIDHSGNFIIVANQVSNNLVVFKRDLKTGMLKRTGKDINLPQPSCVQLRDYNF